MVINFESALQRLDNNPRLLCDMIAFFREDVPPLLEEIETQLRRGDQQAAKRAAHSIKGLAAGFDADETTKLAQKVEQLAAEEKLTIDTDELAALKRSVAVIDGEMQEFLNKTDLA